MVPLKSDIFHPYASDSLCVCTPCVLRSRSERFQGPVALGKDPGLARASALPAPSTSSYLGKSCSISLPLSLGGGRGTRWGRSHAGSPGSHPGKCTGCRAGGRRSGRPGATPHRASMSSPHARRLEQGGQEGRRLRTSVLASVSGPQGPHPESVPTILPAKCIPGYKTCPMSLTSLISAPDRHLLKMEIPPWPCWGKGSAGLVVEALRSMWWCDL
jgi:hypothetical protein